MSRNFSREKKEQIKGLLMEKGRELFSKYGLKKTGIKDLTREAGIGQGTFYKFFSCKEELYFRLIEQEEKELKKIFLAQWEKGGEINQKNLKEAFKRAFSEIENRPLLQNLYQKEEYDNLIKKLPREIVFEHINQDHDIARPIIERAQEKGVLISENPEAIAGLFRALFLISLHKKEIGPEIYPETLELILDLIARGLIREDVYNEGN